MSRVLITGAGGFVGANLVRRCLADGHEVCAVVRPDGDRWRLAAVASDACVVPVDLRDGEATRRAVLEWRPARVFHTAAYGAYSWHRDAERMDRTNVAALMTLLDACAQGGVEAFVNAGSSSEYGPKDHAPDEDEPAEPQSDYGRTKLAATEYCRSFARRRGLPVSTLRLYSVFGPLEDPRRLMPRLITYGLAGALPPLADPHAAHDFIYVDDVCDAFVRAAVHARDSGEIYNVGTGVQTTLAEVVELARTVLPISGPPEWNAVARAGDTPVWIANPARAHADLGWRAETSLVQGVRLFTEWLQAEPGRLDRYRAHQHSADTAP